jgi:hypothetical protein
MVTLVPINMPIAHSDHSDFTCDMLEEGLDESFKVKCKHYENENIDSDVMHACAENDKEDDFSCNKFYKDEEGTNINQAARDDCELQADGEKCKQIK